MTEGWKSLRARFEKLNENHQQDGKTQLNSLQSQNPSKLGVFLYRNRNQDIFSNEEELISLERSYQAILKETNSNEKNKSPIQTLDRISKRYSKLRSHVESKLTTSSPKIHLKRFKADHGSTFFSYSAIHPIIEEYVEEPEEQVFVEEPTIEEIHVEPSTTTSVIQEQQISNEDLTPEDIDHDEFYEEYEEYEEHPVVSTSPIDVTKTIISDSNIEALPEVPSIITVDELKSSDLPITSSEIIQETTSIETTTLPTSKEPEDHVVEYEEEDYMESFEEYDIEESHVVDHTPLTPTLLTDEVFQTPNTTDETIPDETPTSQSLEQNTLIEETTQPTTPTPLIEENKPISTTIIDVSPLIIEDVKPPQQPSETVFVEHQPHAKDNSLEIVEQEKVQATPLIIEDIITQSPKFEEKHSPKTTKTIEKSPEKSIVSPPNVHESKEAKQISSNTVVFKEEQLPEPIKVEEPKSLIVVKPLPKVVKQKPKEIMHEEVEISEPKTLPVVQKSETVETTQSSSPAVNSQIVLPVEKKETVQEKLISEHENQVDNKKNIEPVDIKPLPILKELPQQPSLPVLDSPTKPLPVVPKKAVKALPVVSPKLKDFGKEIFETPVSPKELLPTIEPKSEPESKPESVIEESLPSTETKPEPVIEKKAPEPALSRTASIRSYFSSFLSKTPKKPDPKVSPLEIKDLEKPVAKPITSVVETTIKEESTIETEESDNDTTEHSVVNIEDFLSDGEPESNVEPQSTPKSEIQNKDYEEKVSDIINQEEEQSSNTELLASVLEKHTPNEKSNEGRKVSISSTTDSHCSSGERSDSRKSKRANRKKTGSSPHQKEAGALLLQEFISDSNPSSRSSSTKKEPVPEVEAEPIEHSALEDFIGEDCAILSTISETTSNTYTHPSPSRSDSTHNETAPLSSTPKSLYDLYSPITPKRKEKLLECFVDPSTFPKGWEKPYTFLYTEKPLMEHPLLDKLRRNIIDLLTSSMTEETRVSGVVNINRTSPLLAPLVHSIYSILNNRTKPTIFKSDRDLCTIFSKLEIVKKEKIVQDFLAFKEVRILDPKKLKERDLLFIQYLLQSKLLAVCTYELALNQKHTAMCYEETSIMNLEEYSPTIFAVLNLLKKHFNFELKFEFELSQQAGGSKEEGTLISTLQGNIKTLLQYIIEIGKNEKIPINAITDESKNHNIGKVVRSLIMYILKSILMDKLISESKWKNIAGTLISHPWHLITACAKGELSKVGMNVKTGYSFDSIVLTIDSTVKKKNQTTKQQLLDDKFFSFVAYCLNYQILTDALKFIFKNIMILEKNYRPDSIMCDPVQQDHILTILTPLSKLRFTLNFY